MRFDQAFYTWNKENKMKGHVGGLGVYATSENNSSFISSCTSLMRQDIKPEHEATAEIVKYSDEFKCFVGLGISSRESQGDNRDKYLVHIFVPKDREKLQPENFILDYPFQSEYKEEVLQEVTIGSLGFNGSDIIKKYFYNEDVPNVNKFADFIRCVYQSIIAKKCLAIVLDKAFYPKEQHRRIAQEVMWLIFQLVPNDYVKHLSYGVYNIANEKQVRINFSDRDGKADEKFILNNIDEKSYGEDGFYYTVASMAVRSLADASAYVQEVWDSRLDNPINYSQWDYISINARFKHKQQISSETIITYLSELLNVAKKSEEFRQLLVEKLSDLDLSEFSDSNLDSIWKILLKPISNGELSISKDVHIYHKYLLQNFLERLYPDKGYTIVLKGIPDDLRVAILEKIINYSDLWDKELELLYNIDDIPVFWERYSIMFSREEFKEDVARRIENVYIKASSTERSKLYSVMKKQAIIDYEGIVKRRIGNHKSLQDYLVFLEREKGRFDNDYAQEYYSHLLELANKVSDDDTDTQDYAIKAEKIICEQLSITGSLKLKKEEFKALVKKWEIDDKFRQMASMDASSLLEMNLMQEYAEVVSVWLSHTETRLKSLDISLFKKACDKLDELKKFESDHSLNSLLVGYKALIWNQTNNDVERCLYAQEKLDDLSKFNLWKTNSINSWENDDNGLNEVVSWFSKILKALDKHPNYSVIKNSHTKESTDMIYTRNCYCLWEKVTQHELLYASDFTFSKGHITRYLNNDLNSFIRFLKNYCCSLKCNSEDEEINDTINYLVITESLNKNNSRLRSVDYESLKNNDKYSKIERVISKNDCLQAVSDNIKKEWNSISLFFKIIDCSNVTEENICEIGNLLNECANQFKDYNSMYSVKSVIDKYSEQMKALRQKYDRINNELKELYEQHENAIGENQREIASDHKIKAEDLRRLEEKYNSASSLLEGIEEFKPLGPSSYTQLASHNVTSQNSTVQYDNDEDCSDIVENMKDIEEVCSENGVICNKQVSVPIVESEDIYIKNRKRIETKKPYGKREMM